MFSNRVVSCWNRLPRGTVHVPSLEALKAKLDLAVGNPAQSRGLELYGCVQPKTFCNSMKIEKKF